MKRVYIKIAIFIKRNLFFYLAYLIVVGRWKYISYFPIDRSYDLCLEGFPSSANSFVYNIFRSAFPKLKLCHHTHAVCTIRRAVALDIPVVFLARSPDEAIASILTRRYGAVAGSPDFIDKYISEYSDLYSCAITLSADANFMVVAFEDITSGSDLWFNDLCKRLGFVTDDLCFESLRANTVTLMEEWYVLHDTFFDGVPLPGKQRQFSREILLDQIRNHSNYESCLKLYEKVKCSG